MLHAGRREQFAMQVCEQRKTLCAGRSASARLYAKYPIATKYSIGTRSGRAGVVKIEVCCESSVARSR